jgi:hypothetical protein
MWPDIGPLILHGVVTQKIFVSLVSSVITCKPAQYWCQNHVVTLCETGGFRAGDSMAAISDVRRSVFDMKISYLTLSLKNG